MAKNLTYKELKDIVEDLSPEQLECDVLIEEEGGYLSGTFPIYNVRIIRDEKHECWSFLLCGKEN